MAVPPIIANNPLLKLFRGDGKTAHGEADEKTPPVRQQTAEDIVEISQTAAQKLGVVRLLPSGNSDEAIALAGQVREVLVEDERLILGLDPAFTG